MAEKILNTRILLKYDTLAKWEASTGILRAGEVAIATVPEGGVAQEVGGVVPAPHQVLVKVGDGKHTFAQLPYITAKAGDVYAWAKAEKLGVAAFGEDVQKLFADIENDITALEGKVGNTNVGKQIEDAIKAAIEGLDVEDKEVAGQFVVAVPETDGKVAPARRALVATDIPELAQEKITGLTTRLGNIETAIEDINDPTDGILATAEGKVTALANGAVAANTAAIEKINGTGEGSLAKVLEDAKADATAKANNAETAAKAHAEEKATAAETAAKKYVDEEIAKVTGGGEGSLSNLETRVGVIESDYLKEEHRAALAAATAKVAEDLGKEVTRASNAETALNGRLETVEAFFEAALEDGEQQVIDTLKEIQDYIKSDETGAAEMLASIRANTGAIGEMPVGEDGKVNTTLVEMIAAAESAASQAVANEKLRAEGKEAENAAAAAEADRKAVAAQGEIDALEKVVGTPTEGKTIVEMIAAAQTAATYDDTEVRGLIEDNAEAIGNEVTKREAAVNAVKGEIGVDAQGNYVALTGGHTTLIAAINAANSGVSTNAGNIQKNAEAIAAINNAETGILVTAKGYTDAEVLKATNAITELSGKAVKTIAGDNYIKVDATDVNNVKLSFDTANIVLVAGDSSNLDPAQA